MSRIPLLGGGRPGPATLWRAGAFLATAGVVTGAFGAHGLRNRAGIKPEQIHAFQTASQYSMFNGLSLLVISMHPRFSTHLAGTLITTGSVLFSGSIWGLVALNDDRFKFLGPVTPLGGLFMIAGYLSLMF